MKITLTLTGTHPLLHHNGRLANPLDPHTIRLKSLTGGGSKVTDNVLADRAYAEARGSMWEDDAGRVGIPTEAVVSALKESARMTKTGKNVVRGLLYEQVVRPLLINGKQPTCEEWLKEPTHIDLRTAKVQRNRVLRARPVFPVGWQTSHDVELLDDVIDVRSLTPIAERAGRLIGIGDWRPVFGRFDITIS